MQEAMMTEQPYETKVYYALALDPVHVGAGGMVIGRVDNPIVRDPLTQLPKIPATSLAGVARAYTGMHYPEKFLRQEVVEGKKVVYKSCVGAIAPKAGPRPGGAEEEPCGERTCPVCVTYGFGLEDTRGLPSMAQFFDAQIVFFPVHTMLGPVWVTAPGPLNSLAEAKLLPTVSLAIRLAPGQRGLQTALKSEARTNKLNLGWLLLTITNDSSPLTSQGIAAFQNAGVPAEVLNRLVLVPDELFGQVVNNNLEVRTSTAINHATGASLEGALFTYEAIPRGTVFSFTVVYKDPRSFVLDGSPLSQSLDWVKDNVEKGLAYVEYLGLGGMVTRGMGRLRITS
jgi:CRISPR-associated protein Cmr4